jgi:hypothetical protein
VRELPLNGLLKAPYIPEGPVRQAQHHFVWPN